MRGTPLLIAALALGACDKASDAGWQGYMEGEFVLLASPYAGQLQKLHVRRGEAVAGGASRCSRSSRNRSAPRGPKREERLRSRAGAPGESGAGPPPCRGECARAEVSAGAGRAASSPPRKLAREEKLFERRFTSQARARRGGGQLRARARTRGREAEAQLQNALQPLGRDAERKAAEARSRQARAALAQAAWRVEQKSVAAPATGLVQDTFFVEGEWVPAGTPGRLAAAAGQRQGRGSTSPSRRMGAPGSGRTVQIRCDGMPGAAARRRSATSRARRSTRRPCSTARIRAESCSFSSKPALSPPKRGSCDPGQPIDVRLEIMPAGDRRPGLEQVLRRPSTW